MEVDYGPALPPNLDTQDSHFDDASGFISSAVEEPSRIPSTLPKKSSHTHNHHSVASSSASDHYSEVAEDARPTSTRPKKHSDKSKHKSRARFLTTSSEEDQS